jgi:prolyl-tRNA synthetase
MYWSKLFIPTLRENPAEAEVVSHQLLLRGGYIRQLAAGHLQLPVSRPALHPEDHEHRSRGDGRIGAQEMLLPALNPAEVWQESGRWDVMGENMFRLKDRFGRDLCLGMTHEEVMTSIARGELRSYKQLPQIWYQIQTKFRDEPRPKSGLLRVRQFIMKDSYSFDLGPEGLDVAYEKHHGAYCRIFDRCGLKYVVVEAHSGAMGGSQSHEFMVKSEAGEDFVVQCPGADTRRISRKPSASPSPPGVRPIPKATLRPKSSTLPNKKTIAEIAEFTGLPETRR